MEIFLIILGIIILCLGVTGVTIAIASNYSEDLVKGMFTAIVGALIVVLSLNILIKTTKEETAIECLKGNNLYKMEIQYELKDSVYIPVDTIYVKIK